MRTIYYFTTVGPASSFWNNLAFKTLIQHINNSSKGCGRNVLAICWKWFFPPVTLFRYEFFSFIPSAAVASLSKAYSKLIQSWSKACCSKLILFHILSSCLLKTAGKEKTGKYLEDNACWLHACYSWIIVFLGTTIYRQKNNGIYRWCKFRKLIIT